MNLHLFTASSFAFTPVSSISSEALDLSCASAFLPNGSTGLPVSYAISHSPFSLLLWRSLGFARDDEGEKRYLSYMGANLCPGGAEVALPHVWLSLSPYRHFEQSREIFLARRRSYRMARLVCMFSMRSHTHHFPSCHEDPSTSLGMTRREMPSRCCRDDRSGGWYSSMHCNSLHLARPFSCNRRAPVASAFRHPHGGDRRSGWRPLANGTTIKAPHAFPWRKARGAFCLPARDC